MGGVFAPLPLVCRRASSVEPCDFAVRENLTAVEFGDFGRIADAVGLSVARVAGPLATDEFLGALADLGFLDERLAVDDDVLFHFFILSYCRCFLDIYTTTINPDCQEAVSQSWKGSIRYRGGRHDGS